MGIAGIYNVPETEEERAVWSTTHANHHRVINDAILRIYSVSIPEYILDPFDPKDMGTWSYQHQIWHDNINQVLGIEGLNLLDVDWEDLQQRVGFIQVNAALHLQASNILEIG